MYLLFLLLQILICPETQQDGHFLNKKHTCMLCDKMRAMAGEFASGMLYLVIQCKHVTLVKQRSVNKRC